MKNGAVVKKDVIDIPSSDEDNSQATSKEKIVSFDDIEKKSQEVLIFQTYYFEH